MHELLRTNDIVLLSWLGVLLKDFGIPFFIADRHTSIMEGSIGAIAQRVMVSEEDLGRARKLLDDAEITYAI